MSSVKDQTDVEVPRLPLVDLAPLKLTSSDVTIDVIDSWTSRDPVVRETAKEIIEAFSQIGFVYLMNHGIPELTTDKAYKATKDFFMLPTETKSKYSFQWPKNNNGWIGIQKERLDPAKPADYKEAYNVLAYNAKKWPDEDVTGFRDCLLDLHAKCVRLTHVILMLIGIGLDLEEPDFFVKKHNIDTAPGFTTLRSLFYPKLPEDIELSPGAVRCGEHTDFGTVTLLFQDNAGGLEVMHRDGYFVPAVPVPGSVLVNVADALQRWTSDKLVSTRHRVLIPSDEVKKQRTRQSLAFFVHTDDDAIIECIDGSNKYPPIVSADYTAMRLTGAQKVK